MKFYKKLYLLSRVGRIRNRLKPYINTKTKKKYENFQEIFRRIRTYLIIRNIAFVFLYASVASTVLGDIVVVSEVSTVVAQVGGLIGTAVFAIIVAITQRLANLELADAQIIASEIIAA